MNFLTTKEGPTIDMVCKNIENETLELESLRKKIFKVESELRRNTTLSIIENDASSRTLEFAMDKEKEIMEEVREIKNKLVIKRKEKGEKEAELREIGQTNPEKFKWLYYRPVYRDNIQTKEQRNIMEQEFKNKKEILKEDYKRAILEHEEWLSGYGMKKEDPNISKNNVPSLQNSRGVESDEWESSTRMGSNSSHASQSPAFPILEHTEIGQQVAG